MAEHDRNSAAVFIIKYKKEYQKYIRLMTKGRGLKIGIEKICIVHYILPKNFKSRFLFHLYTFSQSLQKISNIRPWFFKKFWSTKQKQRIPQCFFKMFHNVSSIQNQSIY
jgi:hypothetical protein